MTVRIKELVIRYEDDGEASQLSAAEYAEKFQPLRLVVHHHCAPPPDGPTDKRERPNEAEEYRIDLSKLPGSEK